jgi:dihydroxyacetone kinase-like protein
MDAMPVAISKEQVLSAMQRVIERVLSIREELNQLDAAMGDGDTGITASKGATGLKEYLATNPPADDLGLFFMNAGKAINKAASSTLGTLTSIALMKAGNEIRGSASLDADSLQRMLNAADRAIQDIGKAKPGDKTIVDVLHPAAESFTKAFKDGNDLQVAAMAMLEAARKGRDDALPLRSKMGRGAWVGDRSENTLDPGTVLFVSIFEAILNCNS